MLNLGEPSPSVSNLFPAIAQSFAVIIIGYVFGYLKIIPPSEARSIGTLVGKLALPALLFKNLAILDLSSISWSFLGGMLIAKFFLFLGVVVITLLVTRPFSLGRAGLYGIFATQSNDFALGLPIVTALYGSSMSGSSFDYVSYIYLLAPVSLAIINPIGFCLMEYNKQASKRRLHMKQIPIIVLRTIKGVVMNPVIFMTVLGILVNVIISFGVHHGEHIDSDSKLPGWLTGFLDILGQAYAACALFNIGIFMVGKLKKVTGTVILVATLLIVAKTIILPLVAYRVLYILLPNGVDNATATQDDIATFGFLLGTFPTAPTVFVFASQYSLAMEVVAASLVLCTFMSAPIMYVSARMVLITYATESQYSHIISDTQKDVTVVTCICVVWVFTLFLLARRYRSYAHVFVMHLMVAMVFESIGIDVLGVLKDRKLIYWEYFWWSIFFIGVLGSRMWTASLSVGLTILVSKGIKLAERAWLPLMFISWGVPFIITLLLVSICAAEQSRLHQALVDVSFLFGEVQLILSLTVLIFCFLITTICTFAIVLITRSRRRLSKKATSSPYRSSPLIETKPAGSHHNMASDDQLPSKSRKQVAATNKDSGNFSSRYGINSTGRLPDPSWYEPSSSMALDSSGKDVKNIQGEVSSDEEESEKASLLPQKREISPEPTTLGFGEMSESAGVWYRDTSGKHLTRFVVLHMFLILSMLMGILIVIWKISKKNISGIFIAVNVVDTVTNFGQGFFVFAVFGFEKHWFWILLYKKIRKLLFHIETVTLPLESELDVAVVNLCAIFQTRYLQQCKEDIVSDKRYYLRKYESVFCGSELVDWLMERELVSSREEAVEYGHSLMLGRVIAHVANEHYFHDDNYFYKFLE